MPRLTGWRPALTIAVRSDVPMTRLTRRAFLATAAAVAVLPRLGHGATGAPVALRAQSRGIEVTGKAAPVLRIGRPAGW